MKVFGICKVRNEELIIKDTLDHWAKFCTGGIVVYDDNSTDKTRDILYNHPAVIAVIVGGHWDENRERAEWMNRQFALNKARMFAGENDWICCFDADERLYGLNLGLFFNKSIDAIACRLFDVYITPEDKDLLPADYAKRNFVGPEHRTIVFFFRNKDWASFNKPDQRIVNLPDNPKISIGGLVKHYGKGLSVEHFEETCDYYIKHWPKYKDKWLKRKGGAIHDKSDFGNELIKFEDVLIGEEKGFSLETMDYGKN